MKLKLIEYKEQEKIYCGWLINDMATTMSKIYRWDIDGKSLDGKQNLTIKDVTLFWNIVVNQD